MTNIIVTANDENPESWTRERRLAEWDRVMRDRARTTEQMARLYVPMRKEGELPEHPWHQWLIKVASGTLRGGLVDILNHRQVSLGAVAKLTLADQDRLLALEKFPVVEGDEVRNLNIREMDPGQPVQVFFNGRILTVDEQRKALGRNTPAPRAEPKYVPRLDQESGQIKVGPNIKVPVSSVVNALGGTAGQIQPPLSLRGEDLEKAGYTVVGTPYPNELLETLNREATKAGTTIHHLILSSVQTCYGRLTEMTVGGK